MARRDALLDLAAMLRGEAPAQADWMEVLWLANTSLVTPQLHAALERNGQLGAAPAEVQPFLAEVQARNGERNRRLFGQLHEAVGILNGVGIEPVLLKGSALWFTLGQPARFARMLNDLDLLVRPDEAARAVAALEAAGFEAASRYSGAQVHVVAELGRPQDVGFIDLHQRPPGPQGIVEMAEVERHCRPLTWEGVRFRLPSPTLQLFLFVLHDQFHDGDYWRGGISIRHLIDVAALLQDPAAIDWEQLRAFCQTSLVRHTLEAELAAAHRLLAATVPPEQLTAWGALQFRRRMAQYAWPSASRAISALAVVSEAPFILAHRAVDGAERRRRFGRQETARSLAERRERIRHIFAGEAHGKV